MTSVGTIPVINTSVLAEHDDAKHRAQRRQAAQAEAATRATNQRRHKHAVASSNSYIFSGNKDTVIVAPKWRRNQEDYINPHLLPHERDPIAPRYGPDSVCQRLRARDDMSKCSCSYCVPALHRRAEQKRDAQLVVKRAVTRPGRAGIFSSGGRWADSDSVGWDAPLPYEGDLLWMFDCQGGEPVPRPTVDLMSLAKPAKARKRNVQRTAAPSSRTHSLAMARAFLEPVATGSGVLPDIDEISILDFEETWEHLDLERLNLGVDDERGSEWQWERFSEF